jgi:hypothetical protein
LSVSGTNYKSGELMPAMNKELDTILGKPSFRAYNQQYGVTTNWDSQNEIAGAVNPGGGSLSFRKGKGDVYGVGFDPTSGYHYISNPDVYNRYLELDTNIPTQQPTQAPQYKPPTAPQATQPVGQYAPLSPTQPQTTQPPVLPNFQSVPNIVSATPTAQTTPNIPSGNFNAPTPVNPQNLGQTGPLPTPPVQQVTNMQGLRLAENQLGITEQPFTAQRTSQIENLINNLPSYTPANRQEILKTLNAVNDPFKYNPYQDAFLQQAQGEAQKSVMDEMNRRGILNSTVTADRASQATAKLVPEYEAIAYSRYNDNLNKQLKRVDYLNTLDLQDYNAYRGQIADIFSRADVLNKLDLQDFDIYKQNLDLLHTRANSIISDSVNAIKNWEKKMEIAKDRTSEIGYVDNESSVILGLPPGTLSKDARQRIEDEKSYINQKKIEMEDYKAKQMYDYNMDKQKIIDAQNTKVQQDSVTNAQSNNLGLIQRTLMQYSVDDQIKFLTENASQLQQAIGTENYNALSQGIIQSMPDLKKQKQSTNLAGLNGTLGGMSDEQKLQYLVQNASAIIENIGPEAYNALMAENQKLLREKTKEDREFDLKTQEFDLKSSIETGKLDIEASKAMYSNWEILDNARDKMQKNLIEAIKTQQGDRKLDLEEIDTLSQKLKRENDSIVSAYLADLESDKIDISDFNAKTSRMATEAKIKIDEAYLKVDEAFKKAGIEQEWAKTYATIWKNTEQLKLDKYIAETKASAEAAGLAIRRDELGLAINKFDFSKDQWNEENFETSYKILEDNLVKMYQRDISTETETYQDAKDPYSPKTVTTTKYKILTPEAEKGITGYIEKVYDNMGESNIDKADADRIAYNLANKFGIRLEKKPENDLTEEEKVMLLEKQKESNKWLKSDFKLRAEEGGK